MSNALLVLFVILYGEAFYVLYKFYAAIVRLILIKIGFQMD